jgi:hypothetical protein
MPVSVLPDREVLLLLTLQIPVAREAFNEMDAPAQTEDGAVIDGIDKAESIVINSVEVTGSHMPGTV